MKSILIVIILITIMTYIHIKIKNRKIHSSRIQEVVKEKDKNILTLINKGNFDIRIDDVEIVNKYENKLEYTRFLIEKNKLISKVDKEEIVLINKSEMLEYINNIYEIVSTKLLEKTEEWKLIDRITLELYRTISKIDKVKESKKFIDNLNRHKEASILSREYYKSRLIQIKNIKERFELEEDISKSIDKCLNLANDNVVNLVDISIEIDGENINYDNIIITNQGVFVLDIKKNIGSKEIYTIYITPDGEWTKKYLNGNVEKIDHDLVNYNRKKLVILEELLNYQLNIEGMMVVPNNEIIKNSSNIPIMKISEIHNYINVFGNKLSNKDIKYIKSR